MLSIESCLNTPDDIVFASYIQERICLSYRCIKKLADHPESKFLCVSTEFCVLSPFSTCTCIIMCLLMYNLC